MVQSGPQGFSSYGRHLKLPILLWFTAACIAFRARFYRELAALLKTSGVIISFEEDLVVMFVFLLIFVWLFDRLWVCIYIFVFVKNHQIWKYLNIHCSGQQEGRQGWANTEVSCPAHHQSRGHNGIWPETWLCWANPWPHIPNALGQRQGVI